MTVIHGRFLYQELDALAAHLNELGLNATSGGGPAHPPYPASRANGKAPIPEPVQVPARAALVAEPPTAALHSDSDNEEEPLNTRGIRNDGTLPASDPPKPL